MQASSKHCLSLAELHWTRAKTLAWVRSRSPSLEVCHDPQYQKPSESQGKHHKLNIIQLFPNYFC